MDYPLKPPAPRPVVARPLEAMTSAVASMPLPRVSEASGPPNILATFDRIDAQLASSGWHPTSPRWRRELGARSRVSVIRGGRRAGKSQTYARLACAVAYASPTLPGDVPVFAIVSASRSQARDRIATCRAVLDACGLVYSATSSEIRLPHGTEIRVVTASAVGVVSSTLLGAFCDELALWQSENGANPANEIVSLLLPAMATIPWATAHLVSAPYTTRDPHARFYDRAAREPGWSRAHVPTWEGNPSLTEEDCRRLAESETEFRRAFAAEPIDTISDLLYPPILLEAAR